MTTRLPDPAFPPRSSRRAWSIAASLVLLGGCDVAAWPGSDELAESAPAATGAASLAGTVVDESGAPIAGAHVTTAPHGVEATTDEAGHWNIARVLPGELTLVVAAEGYTAQTLGPLTVAAGDTAEEDTTLVAAAPRNGVLRVRVVGPDGAPVEGVTVTATGGAAPVSAETDAEGVARLGGLGGATVNVDVADDTARLTGFSATAIAVPAAGGVDVAAALAGKPAAGATFVGSAACVACHADESAAFEVTAHANALSAVTGTPAEAFAAGLVVPLGDATATFGTVEGVPTLTLTDASGATDAWPVSGFLGGEARGAVPWAERDGRAWPLPVAWIAPDPERPGFADGGWTAGDTAAWLDASDNLGYSGTPPVAASAEAACFGCHATGFTLSEAGGAVSMHGVTNPAARWDEPGVGCEACHGAGSEHVAAADADRLVTTTNPAHLDTARANDVCGQCHDAREGKAGTPYAWSDAHGLFAPGDVAADFGSSTYVGWSNAAARVPHAQVEELGASTHATLGGASRCSDCHTSHGGGYTADTRQPTDDNSLCLGCHSVLTFASSEDAVEAHQKHPLYLPAEPVEEGRCVGCHMPSTAAQLAWSSRTGAGDLRSHRFAIVPPSATLADFTAAGATELAPGELLPNGCQECHAWNQDWFNGHFPGPTGDMTLRDTHVLLDTAYQEMFP